MKNLQHWFRGLLFVSLAWSAAFAAGAVNASGTGAELKPGSVVVQRGTNHAWANRSGQPCRMLFVLIDGVYDPAIARSLA